jgi:hypothetical protein
MKTTIYTGIAISMAVLLSFCIESTAQSNRSATSTKSQPETSKQQNDGYTRNERRHSTNSNGANPSSTRYETSTKESGLSNSAYQSNNKSNKSNKGNNDNRSQSDNHSKKDYSNSDRHQGNNGNHYGHQNKKNNGHHGHSNKRIDKYERYDHGAHHHSGSYDRHNRYEPNVYAKRLPGKKYHHYQFNGDSYYHCDGLFYQYTPSFGYHRVKCPYVIVPSLPARFIVRYYNGQRLAYHQGYYYLPMEYGWMLVPEVAAPQFSMNISINF